MKCSGLVALWLNGGMVLVARAAEVDDKNRVLMLRQPSIINGSLTQGELQRYFDRYSRLDDFFEPSIKYELIVTNDDNLIAEISISPNFSERCPCDLDRRSPGSGR
jgi:hypothetical protein